MLDGRKINNEVVFGDVKCLTCGIKVAENEAKEHIGADEFNELVNQQMKLMVELDSNMITCPIQNCGAGILLEETKVNYNEKDEKGQVVSKQTAEHMAKYRVRCQ